MFSSKYSLKWKQKYSSERCKVIRQFFYAFQVIYSFYSLCFICQMNYKLYKNFNNMVYKNWDQIMTYVFLINFFIWNYCDGVFWIVAIFSINSIHCLSCLLFFFHFFFPFILPLSLSLSLSLFISFFMFHSFFLRRSFLWEFTSGQKATWIVNFKSPSL